MQPRLTVWDDRRPPGYSYAGLFVRAAPAELLPVLEAVRFNGYVGPDEQEWTVLVPARLKGSVTRSGGPLPVLAAEVAQRLDAVVLSAAVRLDRVLRLGLWVGVRAVGSYLSNPAYEAQDDDVAPDPDGVEHAAELAAACGHADRADELAELLGVILDEDEQTESERLTSVLRLLELPRWLVAATSLPKDVPGGPGASEVVRLFRGRTGLAGRVRSWLP